MDSLTGRIAVHLGVRSPDQVLEVNVAYTLTHSPEALRNYVKGIEAMYRFHFTEAIEQFEAATTVDSTFALAYYYLSVARAWHGVGSVREPRQKALKYADSISERERLLIEADLVQGLAEKKTALEQYVARYPNEKIGWYRLGEVLFHAYWPKASLRAFLKAIELDPNFLLAYIHPIHFYVFTGRPDKATPLITKALSLDSLSTEFHFNQAVLDYYSGKRMRERKGFLRACSLQEPIR